MAVGKAVAHLCLTLFVKELKISVDQVKVVTTLNIIKHQIFFLVWLSMDMIIVLLMSFIS